MNKDGNRSKQRSKFEEHGDEDLHQRGMKIQRARN